MEIVKLTKEQKAQLRKVTNKTGGITEIHRNTGVARSTIYNILEDWEASEETITKVFNYLNQKREGNKTN